jgi:benzoyl-CoA reductase subunit C
MSAVVRWKRENPGKKAIGCLPVYVPRELIHAAGMLPVGVIGHGDIEIIRGDAYFQSYICHLPRSVIDMGVSGKLDSLDGCIFPAICDVIRNLSGMWEILFPEKYSRYLDVPQNFSPEVGGRFYRSELKQICDDLERLGGHKITDEALRESISVFNENRQHIQDLYQARSKEPWRFPTWEVYLIVRAGYLLSVEAHNAMLSDYLKLARDRDAKELDNIRVVVKGSFCEQPPLELLRTIERAGCYIVNDDLLLGTRWIEDEIDTDGDPLDSLVNAYLTSSVSAPSRYEAEGNNGQSLVDMARAENAHGVVFCAPSFCDPALLDQPMSVDALERADIAYTTFKYSENTGQFQVIREQAGTFSDSIRLWS